MRYWIVVAHRVHPTLPQLAYFVGFCLLTPSRFSRRKSATTTKSLPFAGIRIHELPSTGTLESPVEPLGCSAHIDTINCQAT